MQYKLIDHTADFGLHVFGRDVQDLFVNAAHALYDIITDAEVLEGRQEYEIRIHGDDWPDLMVNWLREILFFQTGRDLLIQCVEILSISEYELGAKLRADPWDPDRHSIKTEIKAVTYHQIQVGQNGWEAKIIFDV